MEVTTLLNIDSDPSDVSKNLDVTTSVTEMNSYLLANDSSEKIFVSQRKHVNQGQSMNDKKGPVFVDHCYARPWNWRSEGTFLKATKTLFMPKPIKNSRKRSFNPLAPLQNCNDKIDVEELSVETPSIYDTNKAKYLMEECEKHVMTFKTNQDEDWEESIIPLKSQWSINQHKIFNGMVSILNTHYLGQLSYVGSTNEPIMRRTIIEKSVKRVRHLLATYSWDQKLTQWLHNLLMDHLNSAYLSIYFDILQTLKSKLPTFVDKMIYSVGISSRSGAVSNEQFVMLLKRPWDPVASSLLQDKPKKLPGNPIILLTPSSPSIAGETLSKRQQKWINLLSNLATVISVTANIGNMSHRMSMINCADQMFAATRARLQEVKSDLSGRPVVLIGFNVGAALALQVAQFEHVACVICLGFSLLTADGKRGEPDDSLLELQCPVLFVTGQCANRSSQEEMEDLRERMRIETSLIIVGGADDYLRINKKKKQTEGITQDIVDRCITDEIGEFIGNILLSPVPPQIRHSPVNIPNDVQPAPKRMKMERRRMNSNDSSIDSEPPSPTPRIVRPVGRPPGSKSKSKLDSRWVTQLSQGTSPIINLSPPVSPRPPPSITPTPSESSVSETTSIDLPPSILSETLTKISNTTQSPSNILATSPIPQKQTVTSPNRSAQAAKINSGVGRSLFNVGNTNIMMKKEMKGVLSKITSGIKVLDNVVVSNKRFISGKGVEISKINKSSGAYNKDTGFTGNGFMSEAKMKSSNSIRSSGNTSKILPMYGRGRQPGTTRYTKYVTSRKTVSKKGGFSQSVSSSLSQNLPLATNLTSQDIMDLPIIFADDNQILTEGNVQSTSGEFTQLTFPKNSLMSSTATTVSAVNKLVFTNKPAAPPASTNIFITNSSLKRPALTVPVRASTHPVKYTKIILSRPSPISNEIKSDLRAATKLTALPADISIKKIEVPIKTGCSYLEPIDLEKELVATTVPKPNYALIGKTIVEKSDIDEKIEKTDNNDIT